MDHVNLLKRVLTIVPIARVAECMSKGTEQCGGLRITRRGFAFIVRRRPRTTVGLRCHLINHPTPILATHPTRRVVVPIKASVESLIHTSLAIIHIRTRLTFHRPVGDRIDEEARMPF